MRCKSCSHEKLLSDFYASNKSRCKECVKESVNKYRQENLESIRTYDRMRGSMPHRIAARAEYQKTHAFSERHEAATKRWAEKHPKRRKASHIVSNAIRDGRLVRPPLCLVPDCNKSPQAHHPDYDKPLSVVWLCSKHHAEAHKISRKAA